MRREERVKRLQRIMTALCCLMLLVTPVALADDGFSTSYTYTYDYWDDVQESPDAYRVVEMIDSTTLGLDSLGGKRLNRPQSLFVQGDDLYVCDTGNNRILQLRREGNTFSVSRIIDTVYDDKEDYDLADTSYLQNKEYEKIVAEYNAANKDLLEIRAAQEAGFESTEFTSAISPLLTEAGIDIEATSAVEEFIAGLIEEKQQAVDEVSERMDAARQVAQEAADQAREAGCRIWQYELWTVGEDGNVFSPLNGPNDISVDEEGNIYVADTNSNRVIKMDRDCRLLLEFIKPLDATFDQSQAFLPRKIVTDVAGRVYALCQNINKGLVKYENDGTFSGFIGANTVSVSMAEYIWKRYFQTKEQRAQSASFVPTEYENIYIDKDGFIYATNIVYSEGDLLWDNAKPIRRLNSLGSDILIKNDRRPPIGDVQWVEGGPEATGPSRLVDITVMDDDLYVALDRIRGRLFGYDSQGVLLWAFGTRGNVEGAFTGAVSLEHMGRDLLVLDQFKNSITLFQTTEYGDTIYKATEAYLGGDYDRSADLWRDVLKMNANYPLAFRGIGRAVLRQNQYEDAMEWFKLAHDRENYGRAFKLYRKDWVEANVWWIILIVAAVLIIPLAVGRIRKMKWEVSEHERSKVRK